MDFKRSLSSLGRALKSGSEKTLKKSTVFMDISRINILIASKEKDMEDIYCLIGEKIYKKYGKELLKYKELKEMFNELELIEKDIKKLRKEISVIKKEKFCPYCGESIDKKSKFCLKCGKLL